tara:strand:+ start:203 stop:541 length:339 start_codon:yes stop_codon:yes gene_type:complete
MSINPGLYNIKLYKRSDWSQSFILKDPNGAAVNLSSGYTIACEFWNKERTKMHVEVTTAITDGANGKITLSLTDEQTSLLPDTSYYDVKVTSGSTSDLWIQGTVTANEGYTT